MTYKPPEVEEYEDLDDLFELPKRKREPERTPTGGEDALEEEILQPPNKVPKLPETPLGDPLDEEGLDDAEADFLDDEVFNDAEEFGEGVGEEEDEVDEEGEEEPTQEEIEAEDEDEIEGEEEEDEVGEEEGEGSESSGGEKLNKTIEQFGRTPLHGTAISEKPLTAAPDTILAMLIDAMLKSRPISHDLSQRAVNKVIDVGFHDIRKLGDSSWEERTMVLQDGGYNRYREQGATNLGELVELVDEKYDGDLNNLLKKADYDRQRTRKLVKEIKGLGDLGADLFFNNVQSVWPSIAPFVDSRSLKTAREVGIGTDLDAIYADLEEDSMRMSKLANALSSARLEKRVGELVAI